jgi:hypothetical protein
MALLGKGVDRTTSPVLAQEPRSLCLASPTDSPPASPGGDSHRAAISTDVGTWSLPAPSTLIVQAERMATEKTQTNARELLIFLLSPRKKGA